MTRFLLIALIFFHGLIHVMGFVKAFHFAEMKQLTVPISKPIGILWLMAAVLLIFSAVFLFLRKEQFSLISIIAVVLSQIVIVWSWQDARFGTIVNLILLVATILIYFQTRFYIFYRNDVKEAFQKRTYFHNTLLTEEDIQPLPTAVRKYLRYTGCIGKPKVNHFKINFIGKIRKDETSEWMPFTSEQYNFMTSPTRLFFMNAKMKKLPVAGYHRFVNGDAFMDIRLLSFIKVQYQHGDQMDQAETVTFFNDMCCLAPATLIDKRILWKEVSMNIVSASFTNNGITIHADLIFNNAGRLINFTSYDRYNADAGKQLPWSTPLKDYKPINGYLLASNAEAIYTYPDRDLCYGVFQVASVIYNPN